MKKYINIDKLKEEINKAPVWASLSIIDIIDEMAEDKEEPTWEEIKEYCDKRCLSIMDNILAIKLYDSIERKIEKHNE